MGTAARRYEEIRIWRTYGATGSFGVIVLRIAFLSAVLSLLKKYQKRVAYLDETAYQPCDGFTVNTGYFSLYFNVGGTFDKENEEHDAKKYPVPHPCAAEDACAAYSGGGGRHSGCTGGT
jgi:hypothetical protein